MRGAQLGFPIFLGYFPVGMAFGILAVQQGFSPFLAILCSATSFAGAGQFIALSMMLATGSVTATLFANAVVNLRYILFAASLSPYVKRFKFLQLFYVGLTLTDESFAVNTSDLREKKASFASMAGVGFIAWIGWVSGTVLGSYSANLIGDPTRFGIDFAMAAMFSALLIALAENWHHLLAAAIAAALVLMLALLNGFGILAVNPNLFMVIGSLGAATIASILFKKDEAFPDEAEMLVSEAQLSEVWTSEEEHDE